MSAAEGGRGPRGWSAAEVVAHLGLAPHPEGGFYREVFRHRAAGGGRGAATSIYFLLERGRPSAWHRVVDAVEIWNHHAGAPLALHVAAEGGGVTVQRLGDDLAAGEEPQAVVPAGAWQRAESLGGWSLVGCTVAPAFEFERFELAPPGWQPGGIEGATD